MRPTERGVRVQADTGEVATVDRYVVLTYDAPCIHGPLMSFVAKMLPNPLPKGARIVVEIPA